MIELYIIGGGLVLGLSLGLPLGFKMGTYFERERCKLLAYEESKRHVGTDADAEVACLKVALAIADGRAA